MMFMHELVSYRKKGIGVTSLSSIVLPVVLAGLIASQAEVSHEALSVSIQTFNFFFKKA